MSPSGARGRPAPAERAGTVGIVANPAAGKDIRRLVSAASPSSDMAKIGIVRRAIVGAIEGGAERVLVADDHKALGQRAIAGLDPAVPGLATVMEIDVVPTSFHTQRVAAAMRDAGVGALVVLGGDGTHRDVAKGWRNAPLVAVSTGTNNVFPRMIEATVAGHAAAIAARGRHSLWQLAHRAKVLEVRGGDVADDLALVDVALVEGRFTAARAVWDTTLLRELVVTTAEPATIGLSSIAARVLPVDRREPGGVHLRFGSGELVRAPVAPGRYEDVLVESAARLSMGDTVRFAGPGVVAFDGERDLVLDAGRHVEITLTHDGPWVIDPGVAMAAVGESRV